MFPNLKSCCQFLVLFSCIKINEEAQSERNPIQSNPHDISDGNLDRSNNLKEPSQRIESPMTRIRAKRVKEVLQGLGHEGVN